MNRDLTVGKPSAVLFAFCMPLFGSIIFQQLYNIADSLVAGKFIGELALAAVGNSYEVTLIFIAFAFGCNVGCSVIVSTLFGAKNYRDLKTAVYTTLIASSVLCAALMALGFVFSGPLLTLIQTPDELLADSLLYLRIYIAGLPFLFYYNVSTGIFSALGDSRTPFIFLAFSSTANILVDILFVTAFALGIAGVALATFLCQGVSACLALIVVMRRLKGINAGGNVPLFSARLLKRILGIAVPSTLQQSFLSVGNITIQGIINGFGAGVIAGYAASVKMNNLLVTSLTTLASGVSNFTAQNLGAGKMGRIREGHRAGVSMVWAICVVFFILYFFFGKYGLLLFMDDTGGTAMQTGMTFLRILSPFYFVMSAKLVTDGVLRGSGMMGPFMGSTFTDLILRVAFSYIFSRVWGSTGIWLSWPVGWCLGTVVSVFFYLRGPWAKKGSTPEKA